MSKKILPCRYCHLEVEEGAKQCVHCGTHNPTIGVKNALLWTVGTIGMFYIVWYLSQQF